MSKKKSLKWQAISKLKKMEAFGQSKHAEKLRNGGKPDMDKLHSYSTMRNYQAVAGQFATWASENHGCKTLDEARPYAAEYLDKREAAGLSAFTIHKDCAALAKLYQVPMEQVKSDLPIRHGDQVTQHRGHKEAGHFRESNHQALSDLCHSCGLRRSEVANLRPEDVRMEGGRCLVTVRQGKGGKARVVPALDNTPARLAAEAAAAGRDRVIEHIPNRAPIHAWRRDFAKATYHQAARPIAAVPPKERYCCRGSRAGTWYDKQAMQQVSDALGHERLDVVVTYITD